MQIKKFSVLMVLALFALTACSQGEVLGKDIPLRIMPLGDGITEGMCDTLEHCTQPNIMLFPSGMDAAPCSWAGNLYVSGIVGYRAFLREKLKEAEVNMEFVGSVNVDPGLSHEGHTEWTIADLDFCVQHTDWLESAQPNIILLHAGTADANWAKSLEVMVADLEQLLTHIYEKLPETTEVIVAQILPAKADAYPLYIPQDILLNDIITPYNAAIPGVVEKFRAEGKHVSVVDMSGVMASDSELDNFFGIYPNTTGYAKMADAWSAKIQEVIGWEK